MRWKFQQDIAQAAAKVLIGRGAVDSEAVPAPVKQQRGDTLFAFRPAGVIMCDALLERAVYFDFIQVKRVLPGATPRVNTSAVLTGDSAIWLDPRVSFG